MKPHKYLVAIIGRPNVGKSTIFNRIIGERKAILSEIPGTTRDVLFGDVTWRGETFTIADTAGIEPDNKSELNENILLQTKAALGSADIVLFMVNAQDGIHPDDHIAADMIRRYNAHVILLINKTDSKQAQENVVDFLRLGFKHTYETSGLSGKGTGDVLDEVVKAIRALPPREEPVDDGHTIRISIVGRPNAGKSTLFNRFLGQQRSLTSDVAGTTRDAVDEDIKHGEYTFKFIDTAGLRRRGKVEKGIEKVSALQVLKSVQRSDIALVVMEAHQGVISQDLSVMQIVLESSKSPFLLINKWDLVDKSASITADYDKYLDQKYKFAKWIPRAYISGLTGQRVEKLKDVIVELWKNRNFEFPEEELALLVKQAVRDRPLTGKDAPTILGVRQVGTNPPLVQLRINKTGKFHNNHLRYIENKIRERWSLSGAPIEFSIRQLAPTKEEKKKKR